MSIASPTTAERELRIGLISDTHGLLQIDIDPQAAGVQVVVSGHSHRPLSEERDGVLFINPGSAGPRRFKLPISLAELRVRQGRITSARIVELGVEGEGGAEPRA